MLAADCSEVAGARSSTYGELGSDVRAWKKGRTQDCRLHAGRPLHRSRRGQALHL